MRAVKINVPNPSSEQVEHYLRAWDELENYHLQEDALDKLFFTLCPENIDMLDILLKVVALNDFYSTNIFSVYPVAKHILSLDIDARLESSAMLIPCAVRRALIFSPLVAFGVSAVAASARTSCVSSKFVSFFMSCLHVGYFAVFCRKGKLPVRSSNFFCKAYLTRNNCSYILRTTVRELLFL